MDIHRQLSIFNSRTPRFRADFTRVTGSCQAADQQSAINQLLQYVDDIDVIKPAETELG